MALSSEMGRLTQGFVQAFDDRIAKVMDIRASTAECLAGFHAAHERMGAQQRRCLADFVGGLQRDVATMLKSLDMAHDRMAADQRERLAAQHKGLVSDVSAMRSDLGADHRQARKAWNSFNTLMRGRRAKKFAAAPKKAAERQTGADDLTTIAGIGPGRLQRLSKMGIHSFAKLARFTPDKLRTALGPSGNLANVEQWIKEAKKRSPAHA